MTFSPHTLLESVWQAASSWVVGFIVGERTSIVVFPCICGFAMADWESRVSVKCFVLNLGKTAAETHEMLKQSVDDNRLGRTKTYDWYNHFKSVRTSTDRLMMTIVRDGRQLASQQKIPRKLGIWSCKIFWSSKTAVTPWDQLLVHVNEFFWEELNMKGLRRS
jgi:hypothetical protein